MSDDRLIYQSTVFQLKKCEYMAHACIVASYEDAKDMIAKISLGYYSAHCSPYALRLDSDNGVEEYNDDMGEFSAGSTLASCLRSFENLYSQVNGANILLVLTRKVSGCFVTDMIQHQKYNAIRTCGHKALNKLNKHTVIPILPPRKDTGNSAHSTQPEEQAPVTHIDAKFKRPVLPTPAIRFDPDKFDLPPIPNSADKRKGRSGHFLQP
mmetsp:Transcript_22432/g.32715  ORF Transcript_22432/g.32715 Transcript_22432/m.32715 type:complete len:210 (-) Transcript_22432:72-701(-)